MLKTKKINKRFLSAVFGFSFAFASVPYMISCASIPVCADSFEDSVNAAIAEYGSRIVNVYENEDITAQYWEDYLFVCEYQLNTLALCVDSYLRPDLVDWSLSFTSFCGLCKIDDDLCACSLSYSDKYCGVRVSGAHSAFINLSISDDSTFTPAFSGSGVTYNANGNANYTLSSGGAFQSFNVDQIFGGNYSTAYFGASLSSADPIYNFSSSFPSFTSNYYPNYNETTIVYLSMPSYFPTRASAMPLNDVDFSSPAYAIVQTRDYLYNNYDKDFVDTVYIPISGIPEPVPDPVYPSEFVTGIPKEWTVENPQLPTASDLEFEHYEEDLTGFHPIQEIKETVDIIKAMDFWWWLTEKTLDSLNLKIFYVIFLTVGVLIFIVWIIGQ